MSGIKISIFREGVSKDDRSLKALDPVSVQLNDKSIRDLLDSTRAITDQIAYYNIINNVDGNWQSFFPPATTVLPDNYLDYLLDLSDQFYDSITTRNITPHLALFLAFLALSQKLKSAVNKIPARHFDFFTNDILQFKPKPGIPDKAIVLLELLNNALPYKLDQGTSFSGGKGFDQQDIIYKSEREIIVNQAKITDWRTSFRNPDDLSKIYITAPAAVLKEDAVNAVADEKGWMVFGEGRLKDAGLVTVPAPTGWAIESPNLYMQEGERSVFIDILFDWLDGAHPLPPLDIPIPVESYITTAKGWMKADVMLSQYRQATHSVITNVNIPASFPAIIPGLDLPENIKTKWPVIKMVVSPDNNSDLYDFLQYIAVKKIDITVTVNGVKNVKLETTTGPADPAHSFLPFGSNPSWGSRLYIGLNEIKYKNLLNSSLTYKWKKAPKDFGVYYQEYFSNGGARPLPAQIPIGNGSYSASLRMLKDGKWGTPFFDKLFPVNPSADEKIWENFTYIPASQSERSNGITDLVPVNNFPSGGYWSLTFDLLVNNSVFKGPVAFGQDEYPIVLTEIAIGKATGVVIYNTVNLPNAPYTPEIDYITVSYTASEGFETFSNNPENRFYHVSTFGIYEPDSTNNQLIPRHLPEGFLYIGVEQLTPPQNLSILFQVKEKGSDTEINPDFFSWSYLSGNKWINLNKQQVVIDQTFGLKTSGIVELSIPGNASLVHTAMPAGKHWIRLGVFKDVPKVNPVIDLQTQAVRLVYTGDLSNKPSILPPDSIKMLVGNNGQIKSIKQPYQSYGGQDTETDALLRLRTHERLRHRDRNVNYWDYERLVLDGFSEVYKTKTLQCTNRDLKNAPGHVTMVAIPDQRGNNIIQPKCSQLLLDRIEAFMVEKSQPGIILHAVNPSYETVYFDFYVSFLPGLDTGYYQQQLNEELKAFISPWAFDKKEEIYFSSIFYKTDIIRFIETREYVGYISRFEMYSTGGESAQYGIGEMFITASGELEKLDDFIIEEAFETAINDMVVDDNFIVGRPVDVAVASSPSGILVTASNHRIRIIEAGTMGTMGISGIGIGSMAIEIDFIIP